MTPTMLLDMTRAVGRRWCGATPSGIDRVCDAYATHFADRALAVIQIRGRDVVLDEQGSRALFDSLDAERGAFRRLVARLLAVQAARRLSLAHTAGALYLNVGHSDFDLPAHWRWVQRRQLRPVHLLHDLIPVTHPDLTTAHKSGRHRGRVTRTLHHAAGIIMTTDAAASDLCDFAASLGRSLPPLVTAPIAGGRLPRPLRTPEQPDPPFVSVGTIERRKNHGLLLRCWSLLIDRLGAAVPQLVLAGSPGLGAADLEAEFRRDPRLRAHVTLTGGIDDGALAHLIAGARAVLLPTLAEGFGLPLVEAFALGRPVLASDLPAFREVGQGVPTLLDPRDAGAWAAAVIDIISDGPEHKRQQAALPGFRVPSWPDHFAIVEPWLAHLADEPATWPDSPAVAQAGPATDSSRADAIVAGQAG
jgi:glycosyltransferase involved in cell wall biosynthesis